MSRLNLYKNMAKKVEATIKLTIPGGEATPAPPVGPALGQHGIAIMDFCKEFNQKTQENKGDLIPVEITVYEDRSFEFITKSPPTSFLLKKAAGVEKGSGKPHKDKAGSVTESDIEKIAEEKLPDLNTTDLEKAKKIVKGTAKNMGIEIS